MTRHLILTAGLFALAACGGSEGDGNQAAAGAKQTSAAAGGGGATMQPGQYEVTTEFLAFEVPGMPPEMAAAMKGRKENRTDCITEKELKEAQGGMFTGEDAKQCSENTVSMSGGRMSGKLVCEENGKKSTMEIDGTYTGQSYDVTMSMSAEGARTRARTTGRRVGDCPAGEAEQG